jgi:anti-anti-sigma regulatory factor
MLALIVTAGQERLTLRGACLDDDLRHVVGILEALRCPYPELTLDLSRVSVMSWSVAETILRKCTRMEADGGHVVLRTRGGGAVERMLEAVRDHQRQTRLMSLGRQKI